MHAKPRHNGLVCPTQLLTKKKKEEKWTKEWTAIKNYYILEINGNLFFFFKFNMGVRVRLRALRLITRALKLTTM